MPPTLSANEIQMLSKGVSITIGQNPEPRRRVSTIVALLYYYMTTFDQEVNYIWRSSNRTLGKWLYLCTRYFNIIAAALYLYASFPITMRNLSVCGSVHRAYWVFPILGTVVCPEGMLWLCLYALLRGPKMLQIKWFIAAFLIVYAAPIVTLEAVYRSSFTAIPPPRLQDEAVGRCFYGSGQWELWITASFLRSAWAAFLTCIAIITFMKRWRNPSGRLVSIIRREGGSYYMSAAALTFLATVASVNRMDPYAIFPTLRRLLVPIFADRLILKMREISDPETAATVSALIFDVRDLGDTDDECTYIEGRGGEAPTRSESSLLRMTTITKDSPPETSATYVTCILYLWRRNLK
ncbi:hypothetical protein DFP72DRAFT_1078121 [Ephemerocybe angulata]|uniref:DUF6533 domain-containing protein n=1 Tax=Ephemerocybe angulata TaxID=980116 RepID=A0A8H6LUW9_9AGAR|nr:hypothetical protein DFP72DRAFT_1078121 [Tulosesus angulatus]